MDTDGLRLDQVAAVEVIDMAGTRSCRDLQMVVGVRGRESKGNPRSFEVRMRKEGVGALRWRMACRGALAE